jgi:pullulanase/glycogen debranching enzyme
MQRFIINTYIFKNGNITRENFDIRTDSNNEEVIKDIILDKLKIDFSKFEKLKESFKLIQRENVIIYECHLGKITENNEIEIENSSNFLSLFSR